MIEPGDTVRLKRTGEYGHVLVTFSGDTGPALDWRTEHGELRTSLAHEFDLVRKGK